jgi:hypothetical protein
MGDRAIDDEKMEHERRVIRIAKRRANPASEPYEGKERIAQAQDEQAEREYADDAERRSQDRMRALEEWRERNGMSEDES